MTTLTTNARIAFLSLGLCALPMAMGQDRPRRDAVGQAPVVVRNVVYATAPSGEGEPRPLLMDVAFPASSDGPIPAVIYIHGGGWYSGDKADGSRFLEPLAMGGYLAVSINYRLVGDATWPAALHDCKAAVRFLRTHAEDLGIDPDRIGAWGHSAGAHLAALLGTSGNAPALEGSVGETGVSSAVQCVVDVSGPTDLVIALDHRSEGAFKQWLGAEGDELRRLARQASPVTWIDGADPPCLIVHGQDDVVVPVEQATGYARALEQAGVSVRLVLLEDTGHSVGSSTAYRAMAAFLDEHLGGRLHEVLSRRERD